MFALGGGHDALVELAGLVVLAEFAFVGEVGFARDDVVGDGVWSFGRVRAEFVDEAVRRVLRVTGVIGVHPQLAVEIEGCIVACHEWAVD